jgi:hypothetical protein
MTQTLARGLRWFLFALVIVTVTLLPAARTQAAALGSLYSYTLDGSTATINNAAAANTNVPLNLWGDWSQTAFGVLFEGDTVSKQSVGYAKPTSGYTINVPASQSVGGSVKFAYRAPTSGTCFSDSPNIMQIGKYGSQLSQFKFQISNCGKSKTQVFPQCRVAGLSSGNVPVTGTTALVDGTAYILQCVKSPDAGGTASLTMNLTKLDPVNGNTTYTNTYTITATGAIQSTQYLSVADQYPLKAQANNTDQFNGEIAQLAYCSGATSSDVTVCLDTEVGAQ